MSAASHSDAAPSAATIDLLTRLIAFDSVSRNSNLALIDWARGLLEEAGATTRLSFNEERTKANLFATFGQGPGGLVLSGHSDVVPVDGQAWTTDPFTADIRDGRLYGRGACDMKGFVATALSRALAKDRSALTCPLHLAISYDEEVACRGIPVLIEDLARAGIRPDGCIVGEPTMMRLVGSHKGGEVYRCRVTGTAAHSSLGPTAVNAIEYGAELIGFIRGIGERFRREGPFDPGFAVPYSTISTNLGSGGNGMNIIPATFEFCFEYRLLPGSQGEPPIAAVRGFAERELLPRMRAVAPDADIVFECLGRIPALDGKTGAPVFRDASLLLRQEEAQKVSYGTEASFFQEAGIPSIVCGPGDIAHAHKADEFVALEQLAACERFLDQMIERHTR